ncbi:MAG TPA: methyl-accepting chemotaxis protein [Acidobacteriota bacterium]|nr:methyl-accepting chemotaxis protein [Acidobacteriota bacterium]
MFNFRRRSQENDVSRARAVYRREVERLIKAYKQGRLSERGNLEILDDAFRPMMDGIHEVVEAISAPMRECIEVLEDVASGDLSQRVKGDYEGDHARMKRALNQALESLDQGMMQVNQASYQVASASEEIASGSQSLAQGSSHQAATLEEISASLQEVYSMTKQNAANAQEASGLGEDARGATEKGVDSMRKLSSAIERIKNSADQTSKIVKTIDEIAFQTNLLALNAAVEAARAGEAGRGFAVVAEEVRNLAMRSAEAAKSTSALIDESVSNADDGVSTNEEVLGALKAIEQKVRKVTEVMSEIAAASEQQEEGIEEVNGAVERINQVTQQTAASSQESAATAQQLNSQAEELLALVRQFKLSRVQLNGPQRPSQGLYGAAAASRRSPRTAGYHNGEDGDGDGSSKSDELMTYFDSDSESILKDF